MFVPDRTRVEALQSHAPCLHSGKAAQPNELVGIAPIAELANNPHAVSFLPLNQVFLEQGDELVAATWFERILAQLYYRTARLYGWLRRLSRTQLHAGFSACL